MYYKTYTSKWGKCEAKPGSCQPIQTRLRQCRGRSRLGSASLRETHVVRVIRDYIFCRAINKVVARVSVLKCKSVEIVYRLVTSAAAGQVSRS